VILVENDCGAKRLAPRIEFHEAFRLLRLASHNPKPPFRTSQLLANHHEVPLGCFQLACRFFLSGAELRHTRGLFEYRSALGGIGLEQRSHFALLNDGVSIGADARVHEKFLDVAQPHLTAIDQVLRPSIAVEAARDFHFIRIDRQRTVRNLMAPHKRRAGFSGSRFALIEHAFRLACAPLHGCRQNGILEHQRNRR